MDRSRKQLMEELIRVGRLIDPKSHEKLQKSHQEIMKGSNAAEKPDTDASALEQDLESLTEGSYFVDEPYTTKDMFSTSAENHTPDVANPLETQEVDANTLDFNEPNVSIPEEPSAAKLGKRFEKEENIIGLPVEELARELVTLIEDRVSLRSGEQLDDDLRDDLTKAVTTQLEGWLKYD